MCFPYQEYKSLNYLDIVVNASLSLDSAPENVILRSSHTQVKYVFTQP